MFVIKKLRLNKFQPRPIVSNRALFLSVGQKPATIVSKETSECLNEPSCDGANKNKLLALAQQIGQKAYENSKSQDPTSLNKSQRDM